MNPGEINPVFLLSLEANRSLSASRTRHDNAIGDARVSNDLKIQKTEELLRIQAELATLREGQEGRGLFLVTEEARLVAEINELTERIKVLQRDAKAVYDRKEVDVEKANSLWGFVVAERERRVGLVEYNNLGAIRASEILTRIIKDENLAEITDSIDDINGESWEQKKASVPNGMVENMEQRNAFLNAFRENFKGLMQKQPSDISKRMTGFKYKYILNFASGEESETIVVWPESGNAITVEEFEQSIPVELTEGEKKVLESAIEQTGMTRENFFEHLRTSERNIVLANALHREAEEEDKRFEKEKERQTQEKIKGVEQVLESLQQEINIHSQRTGQLISLREPIQSFVRLGEVLEETTGEIEKQEVKLGNLNTELQTETGRRKKIWFFSVDVSDKNKINQLNSQITAVKGNIESLRRKQSSQIDEANRILDNITSIDQDLVVIDFNGSRSLKQGFGSSQELERQIKLAQDLAFEKKQKIQVLERVKEGWEQERLLEFSLEEAEFVLGDFEVLVVDPAVESINSTIQEQGKAIPVMPRITLEISKDQEYGRLRCAIDFTGRFGLKTIYLGENQRTGKIYQGLQKYKLSKSFMYGVGELIAKRLIARKPEYGSSSIDVHGKKKSKEQFKLGEGIGFDVK